MLDREVGVRIGRHYSTERTGTERNSSVALFHGTDPVSNTCLPARLPDWLHHTCILKSHESSSCSLPAVIPICHSK